jgi:hypothetical protein
MKAINIEIPPEGGTARPWVLSKLGLSTHPHRWARWAKAGVQIKVKEKVKIIHGVHLRASITP